MTDNELDRRSMLTRSAAVAGGVTAAAAGLTTVAGTPAQAAGRVRPRPARSSGPTTRATRC